MSHELTENIWSADWQRDFTKSALDKIITAWLTGRVNHYYNVCDPDYKRKRDTLAKHFELSESPAPERLGESWCKHILWTKEFGWVSAGIQNVKIDAWDFCPICAAPRPAQKKGLAEILHEAGRDECSLEAVYEKEAKAAISYFRDLVESQPSVAIDDGSNQCVEAFRTKLLVTLDREAGGGK